MRYLQVAVTLTLCIACSRSKTATYPQELRDAGTQGEVLVQFNVDTLGLAEMERTVRPLVQQPFHFTLQR